MRATGILLTALIVIAFLGAEPDMRAPAGQPKPSGAGFPTFKTQEIDTGLSIGYAVLVADINNDSKPDIVVVDQFEVVWYENPTWKKRVILGKGKTKADNVCAAAVDIDGDGKLDLVIGAAWKPFDTANPGTLQWVKQGKSLDEEWIMYPIPCDEPTVHRVRVVNRDGKPEIVLAPLIGRDATAKGNWLDGRPVRLMAYPIPTNPEKPESWKPVVLADSLHVVHNIAQWPQQPGTKPFRLLAASYEGVSVIGRTPAGWETKRIGEGNQANPKSNRGASEIKGGWLGENAPVIATIEPWHGNQVVTYTPNPGGDEKALWSRHVVDEHLRWGHAVSFADLDGDGAEELIIGVRDDPNPKAGDTFTDRRGVRIYKCTDGKGAKWDRFLLDPAGVAVEDLVVADLNGDGKIDIVACGRATKNVRIYWNQGR